MKRPPARRISFNPKRRLQRNTLDQTALDKLADAIDYGGNPEHKRNPGDFGLTPPAAPRRDKSLCDEVEIFTRAEATRLLKEGARQGFLSEQMRNGFPQNIWVVTENNIPLEAELECPERGIYHGYPMSEVDPFREVILQSWKCK